VTQFTNDKVLLRAEEKGANPSGSLAFSRLGILLIILSFVDIFRDFNLQPGSLFCFRGKSFPASAGRGLFLLPLSFFGVSRYHGIIFRLYPQSSSCSTPENIILISQVKVINVTNLLNVSSIIFRVGNLLFMYNFSLSCLILRQRFRSATQTSAMGFFPAASASNTK
jgi:hypothetical protein